MTINKVKIGIIGSGPSGLAAAMPFLEYGESFDVTIITSGKSLFDKDVVSMQTALKNMSLDDQHKYWEEKKTKHKGIIPKKLFYGLETAYSNPSDLDLSKEIEFDISHSFGGLSNVWGANVAGLPKNDIKKFDNEIDLKKEFFEITKQFPISGEEDDIDLNSTYKISYNKKLLNYCSQAKKLLNKYLLNKNYFTINNFYLGLSKLSIINDENDSDNSCKNTGLEMYGCNSNSIFNSSLHINKIKEEINLLEDTLVEEIIFTDKGQGLLLYNNNSNSQIFFDKIIIACGTIETSKLVLKSLRDHKKNSLIIKDSQKYFFLYFTFFRAMKNEEKNIIGLSQIFMQTEIDSHTFHLQLYHSVTLLKNSLKHYMPHFFTKFIYKFLDFFLSRIMIGVVYFPEEISHHMQLTYDYDKNNYQIKKIKNRFFSPKYIFKILLKLSKFFPKFLSFPLPFYVKSKVGISQHFGASLPYSKTSEIGTTNIKGQLIPFNNIYISDCSSLPRIPSTPPTYLAMSNAFRISRNIINELIINNKK